MALGPKSHTSTIPIYLQNLQGKAKRKIDAHKIWKANYRGSRGILFYFILWRETIV
jgi:hypothetical protein